MTFLLIIFHKFLISHISYQKGDRTVHDQAWLIDWNNPENNDWLVVNQFTVIENHKNHRPDVVVFINPPHKQEKATLTVLTQAETLCKDWAA